MLVRLGISDSPVVSSPRAFFWYISANNEKYKRKHIFRIEEMTIFRLLNRFDDLWFKIE